MKILTKFAFLILFIFSLNVSAIWNEQKARWKGKTEQENGVKVIKNPGEPLYGEITFELEEDLNIGNEDDENYLFFRLRDIEVDSDGNIYVLDSGNRRLQVFEKNGKYLRTIGKRGQGPGEFNAPTQLQLDDETGNIFVKDNMRRKIIIFEKKGKYIDKDIRLVEVLRDFYLDSGGCIWGIFSLPGIDSRSIKKVTFAGKVEKIFAEIPYHIQRIVTSLTEGMSAFWITHGYEYDALLSKVDSNTFVYGHSKKYELVAVDKSGKTLFIIRKDESPKKITKTERDRITNKEIRHIRESGDQISDLSLEFPDYNPYFYSIITDDISRIYVRKNPVSRESKANHVYDLFNKEGLYLYKIHLNYYPDVIKNGYI
ncbi:MAG: 6-bladed beta-propeller, partial [Candidatus Aminicenantaceae bacterium]